MQFYDTINPESAQLQLSEAKCQHADSENS